MSKKFWPPPGFPIVDGRYVLTDTWSIDLPDKFARRLEDGCLVFWRPGLTIWLVAWNNDHGKSQAERLASIKEAACLTRFDVRESTTGNVTRFRYRLRDENEDGVVEAVHAYTMDDVGHLQMAVYFDDPADADMACKLADSVGGWGRG
jgi:hypothetical protein